MGWNHPLRKSQENQPWKLDWIEFFLQQGPKDLPVLPLLCSCDDQGCDDQAMLSLAEQLEAVEGARGTFSPLNSSKAFCWNSLFEGFCWKAVGSPNFEKLNYWNASLCERSQQKRDFMKLVWRCYTSPNPLVFFCINDSALKISAGCGVMMDRQDWSYMGSTPPPWFTVDKQSIQFFLWKGQYYAPLSTVTGWGALPKTYNYCIL